MSSQDEHIDQIVNQYIQGKLDEAQKYNTPPEKIEAGMNIASFIITAKMLRKAYGNNLPTGEALIQSIAQLMDAHLNEARELCSRFIAGGWMNADYSLTSRGEQLSGQELDINGL